jgi:hypothetical protein
MDKLTKKTQNIERSEIPNTLRTEGCKSLVFKIASKNQCSHQTYKCVAKGKNHSLHPPPKSYLDGC